LYLRHSRDLKKTTLQDLGFIGELIGGIVILITLVYLAVQVRQVRNQMRLNASVSANQLFNDTANAAIASPELAKVRAKAQEDFGSLETWESELLDQYFLAFLNAIEVVYEHHQAGVLPNVDPGVSRSQITIFAQLPGAESYWKRYRGMLGGPFASLVDEHF
jgi:hypothetical protein